MTSAVLAGLLAALVVSIPAFLRGLFPLSASPVLVLGVACLAMFSQRFILDRRSGPRAYDGLADLFIHIHSPSSPDSALRWLLRGAVSMLLAACGGLVGPEGAAIEWGHAASIASRSKMSRWFEQRRRTDASCALAAGVSAAFGAPFAGLLMPIELGMGGRYSMVAVASLVGCLGSRELARLAGWEAPGFAVAVEGLEVLSLRAWLGAGLIGAIGGAFAAGLIRFCRYAQESLLDLFQTQTWMRTLAAGVLLFLVVLTYRSGHAPWNGLLEQVLLDRRSPVEVWLLLASGTLSIAVILAGFGTLGVFWPVLALGGFLGHGLASLAPAWLGGFAGPVALSTLAGGAAFWGAVFGTPLAGAVLAYEITGNAGVLVPCLVAGLAARAVRGRLRTRALFEHDLDARGMPLVEGRSAGVLEAISVRDAMVSDHEIVHEQEPVSTIYPRLLKSRYPFLPVVNSQNIYLGLLTVDVVQDAWQSQSGTSNSPLSKLLEAKDLLYRSRSKAPTIRVTDRLSATRGLFDVIPCIPVLGEDGRVMGLLFVHNVRLAYDREVARRSLAFDERSV